MPNMPSRNAWTVIGLVAALGYGLIVGYKSGRGRLGDNTQEVIHLVQEYRIQLELDTETMLAQSDSIYRLENQICKWMK